MMRRIIIALAGLVSCLAAQAQSICFWTDDEEAVPVRIYIDEEYLGDVTQAMDSTPVLDQEGCLSVDVIPGKRQLTAVDKYGRIYSDWPGHISAKAGDVYSIRLKAGGFHTPRNRDDYAFVFLGWDPVPYRYPYHYGRRGRRSSPSLDDDLMVGMAISAFAATAAMTAVAIKNWDFPDSRFPYYSLGWNTEYLGGLGQWRNTVQGRARFGNLGGVSLMADAGIATMLGRTYGDAAPDHFTWSVGAGLDYGGFAFSIRYKAGDAGSGGDFDGSWDTFLVAQLSYDWWIGDNFGLGIHAGYGISGNVHYDGLMDNYEYPLGLSLLYKF